MALVVRSDRTYSYRSVRRDGRVTSQYRGAGDLAVIREQLDAEARAAAAEERCAADELDRELEDLAAQARELAHAELVAAGYRKVYGLWRRRRCPRT
jgi:hypothetical protein